MSLYIICMVLEPVDTDTYIGKIKEYMQEHVGHRLRLRNSYTFDAWCDQSIPLCVICGQSECTIAAFVHCHEVTFPWSIPGHSVMASASLPRRAPLQHLFAQSAQRTVLQHVQKSWGSSSISVMRLGDGWCTSWFWHWTQCQSTWYLWSGANTSCQICQAFSLGLLSVAKSQIHRRVLKVHWLCRTASSM